MEFSENSPEIWTVAEKLLNSSTTWTRHSYSYSETLDLGYGPGQQPLTLPFREHRCKVLGEDFTERLKLRLD